MIILTIPDALAATLQGTAGVVEIRDPEGNIVGYFAPVSPERADLYPRPETRNGETAAPKMELESHSA